MSRNLPVSPLAVMALQSLLERTQSFEQAHTGSRRRALGPWPPTVVQTNVLNAAIYFLQQYADTLSTEPAG